MYLADTLSRAYLPAKPEEDDYTDQESVNMVSYLPITEERLTYIRDGTSRDETLSLLKEVIASGWPEQKSHLPSVLYPYFPYRDELSSQDGLIFRGERVIKTASALLPHKHTRTHVCMYACAHV